MATAENDIELQLAKELKELHLYSSRLGNVSGIERIERFEQPIDRLDMRWQDQLVQLEGQELHGCRTVAKVLADQPEREANQTRNARDAASLLGLSPNEQVELWNGSNRKEDLSPLTAQERETKAGDIYEQGRAVIQERYTNLREMLRSGVEDLHASREPSLAPFLAQQLELKEQQEKILTPSLNP